MSKLNQGMASSTPVSIEVREIVLTELDAILGSYHFRGSKRYPAFLQYVVNVALEGRAADLKERTLGVEVFGRDPQYDTNTDPVVRISAGEVRKRIAQYYHENKETSQVRIELPLGSYAPEFQFRVQEERAAERAKAERALLVLPVARPARRFPFRLLWIGLALLLAVCAVFGWYSYRQVSVSGMTTAGRLLGPLVKSPRPILIVVGTSHPNRVVPETPETSFSEHTTGPYHHVSLATAIALSNVAGILRQYGRSYEVREDTETSLTDIRSRSLILIGATNNVWTMRLVDGLRYRFIRDRVVQLQDAKNPSNTQWSIDFSRPYPTISEDYGMIARFHDATTEGPVMVVAGVGPYGTEAASEFIASPEYRGELEKQLQPGWENKDFEVVLKTEVIDSKAGPPKMVAQTTW